MNFQQMNDYHKHSIGKYKTTILVTMCKEQCNGTMDCDFARICV